MDLKNVLILLWVLGVTTQNLLTATSSSSIESLVQKADPALKFMKDKLIAKIGNKSTIWVVIDGSGWITMQKL